jgi:DNA-binding SARP family transcriptional activator
MSFGWNQTLSLLKTGDYQLAAANLERVSQYYAQQNDVFLATTAAITQKLCLMCVACATASIYHQQALIAMSEQLDSLNTELITVIDLLQNLETRRDLPSSASPGESKTMQQTLWQRLHAVLGRAHVVAQPMLFTTRPNPLPSPISPVSDQPSSDLAVCCLGPFRVYQHDRLVEDWPSRKGKSIFKYLVTHRERPIPKEVLMELLWPDSPPDAARNNLNVAIYALRQSLRQNNPNQSQILYQDDCYLINPDLNTWVDVEAFTEHIARAHNLEDRAQHAAAVREYHLAEALYLGDFLEEDRYEDWSSTQRQQLQDNYIGLLERLSRHYFAQVDYAACVMEARKILAVDACRESAHRWIMQCYAQQGQRYLAIRQYQDCVDALRNELDVEPSAETTRLYEQILAGETLKPGALSFPSLQLQRV